MQIARKLRTQSITAYIIYMYQVEDVIRAYGLDIERIEGEYMPRFDLGESQRKEEREWYESLIRMMKEEGKTQCGHVQVVRNTIQLLSERHPELLSDPKQPYYSAAYYKALPYIVELRAKSHAMDKGEIENCLDAVYGATLIGMQGRELSEETRLALQPITHLLEMLSDLWSEK